MSLNYRYHEDLVPHWPLSPFSSAFSNYKPPGVLARHRPDSSHSVSIDRDKFQICLDIHEFAPEEISVKTVDGHIVVEAKHEDKEDEHGFVARHFVRKYPLPKDHHPDDVVSSLSSDGVLTITSPKRKVVGEVERSVPIVSTGIVHNKACARTYPPENSNKMQE